MRIITGSARGTRLETPEGLDTRPTAERVKEALFSMIQFEIDGKRVLDLFGGSGQLGLEALSRGAWKATFVDASKEAVETIKTNAKKTKLFDRCVILNTDYKAFIRGAAGKERSSLCFRAGAGRFGTVGAGGFGVQGRTGGLRKRPKGGIFLGRLYGEAARKLRKDLYHPA